MIKGYLINKNEKENGKFRGTWINFPIDRDSLTEAMVSIGYNREIAKDRFYFNFQEFKIEGYKIDFSINPDYTQDCCDTLVSVDNLNKAIIDLENAIESGDEDWLFSFMEISYQGLIYSTKHFRRDSFFGGCNKYALKEFKQLDDSDIYKSEYGYIAIKKNPYFRPLEKITL